MRIGLGRTRSDTEARRAADLRPERGMCDGIGRQSILRALRLSFEVSRLTGPKPPAALPRA